MARSQEQYLSDIDEAMADARRFAEGHDLEDFLEDRLLRYGIERALEIVGEATSNLSEKVKNLFQFTAVFRIVDTLFSGTGLIGGQFSNWTV